MRLARARRRVTPMAQQTVSEGRSMTITGLGDLAQWLEMAQSLVAINRTPRTHTDNVDDLAAGEIRAPHSNESSAKGRGDNGQVCT